MNSLKLIFFLLTFFQSTIFVANAQSNVNSEVIIDPKNDVVNNELEQRMNLILNEGRINSTAPIVKDNNINSDKIIIKDSQLNKENSFTNGNDNSISNKEVLVKKVELEENKNKLESVDKIKETEKKDSIINEKIAAIKNANENDKITSLLWKSFSLVIFAVSVIGLLGFILVKIKKRGGFSIVKTEKSLEIVSSISLSPKRQIHILRVRDSEIVIANTESGINMLAELNKNTKNQNEQKNSTQYNQKPSISNNNVNLLEDKKYEDDHQQQQQKQDQSTEKKSDILMKALKNINTKSLLEKNKNSNENSNLKNQSIKNQEPSFPKYLANQFENESKRETKKRDEDADSVENVTNLIREKLKTMKSLS